MKKILTAINISILNDITSKKILAVVKNELQDSVYISLFCHQSLIFPVVFGSEVCLKDRKCSH